jgi:hypothetical protein
MRDKAKRLARAAALPCNIKKMLRFSCGTRGAKKPGRRTARAFPENA